MCHLHHDKLCGSYCEPAGCTQPPIVDLQQRILALSKGFQGLAEFKADGYEARAFDLTFFFSKFRLHRLSVRLTILISAAHRPLPPSAGRKCLHISHEASANLLAETTILCA